MIKNKVDKVEVLILSKEYQPKATREYISHNLWMQAIYMVRDYNRLINERDAVIDETPIASSGKGKGNISDPTASKVARIENISVKISAIDKAIKVLPEEYRVGIMNNIRYRTPYPDYAHVTTWSRYKTKFITQVIKNMNWI